MKNNIIRICTKCNEKLYEELKPILESFGYIKYNSYYAIDCWDEYPYLMIGYEYAKDTFGNIRKQDNVTILSKEEFLKQAAIAMGKEYNLTNNKNKESMEKKYPVIKCDKKLWNEIKPVLKSFGINEFENEEYISNDMFCIVSNYGTYDNNIFKIGVVVYDIKERFTNGLRYLVDTKEEFLSGVAKLLGKEYPIKEQLDKVKYPVIKCTQQLYDKIEDIIKNVGYELYKCLNFDNHPYLVVDFNNIFGNVRNVTNFFPNANTRYECSNIREFLIKVCELKGFIVSYINNTKDDDFENHYFGYCIDLDNKTIRIYENFENKVSDINPFISKSNNTEKDNKNKESMEKINIAEKLKYCKKGTKLYHLAFGEVEFDNINDCYIIIITTDNNGNKDSITVTIYGTYDNDYPNGECLLFPSKDNRDWNNFNVIEKGHLVMCADYDDAWQLRKYVSGHIAGLINSKFETESGAWKYIVPIEDFDFTAEDISINKEKSIV